MAATSLVPVPFHDGTTLHAVIVDGAPHVAIRSICEALGLDWQAQHARIRRHPALNSTVSVTKTVAADGKQRELVTLPLDKLNGWLFGVSAARVRPELRERLVQYQRECFDVLARHFGQGKARPAPELGAAVDNLPEVDVRSLLLTGQSTPGVVMPAELMRLIDERAWAMAREAHELARLHLLRRAAHHGQYGSGGPQMMFDPRSATRAVQQGTLGHALAHLYHSEITRLHMVARALVQSGDNMMQAMQSVMSEYAPASATSTATAQEAA